jgi:hypothetical protein
MTLYKIDPLSDPRWPELVRRHSDASAFHTTGWLHSLRLTYGYEPMVFTTSPPRSELRNGLVFCEVKSWLTGSRFVSLPFSDHCQPLADDAKELQSILEGLQDVAMKRRLKYIELRPLDSEHVTDGTRFSKCASYAFHKIDLRGSTETIFGNFHDSCIRRKIRKAEREQLIYDVGRSDTLLRKFRHLFLLTRRRHNLPPQPLSWFRNLASCLGDRLSIHVVSKGPDPVASIITLSYKTSLIYKYGCSDARFSNCGGTPLLFWKAIQEGKESGAEELDLGRSDLNEPGLSIFKEHLGGLASELTYHRFSIKPSGKPLPKLPYIRRAFARMPDSVFSGAGRLLYRHMG